MNIFGAQICDTPSQSNYGTEKEFWGLVFRVTLFCWEICGLQGYGTSVSWEIGKARAVF